jgi:hypothetical protein
MRGRSLADQRALAQRHSRASGSSCPARGRGATRSRRSPDASSEEHRAAELTRQPAEPSSAPRPRAERQVLGTTDGEPGAMLREAVDVEDVTENK